MRFFHIVAAVVALLQREGRVTYWALKQEFGFDDAFLEGLREELIFAKRVARDEGGKVLVWTGALPAVVDVVPAAISQHRAAEAPVNASPMAFVLPPLALANALPATPPEVPATAPALAQAAPEAERRQVTVMFCDLVDSTTLSRRLDPEDYRAIVRAYQTAAAEVMQPYNGYIAQYLGDGLMVYFSWPQAHEDAASRAVYASLAILDALAPLNMQLEPQYGVQMPVRIGLHTGLAVVGTMGGGTRQEQLAIGDTPNIAARIQGLAAPDTVALSAATVRLVQDAFVLECMGTHALKGVAEPMAVYCVRGPVETHHDDEEAPATGGPFLLGRDEESGLLRRRWEQTKEGLGQVVLLSGEAGIGKSALWKRCAPMYALRACCVWPFAVRPTTRTVPSTPSSRTSHTCCAGNATIPLP
jgi:class 3 adenylate cyclase